MWDPEIISFNKFLEMCNFHYNVYYREVLQNTEQNGGSINPIYIDTGLRKIFNKSLKLDT